MAGKTTRFVLPANRSLPRHPENLFWLRSEIARQILNAPELHDLGKAMMDTSGLLVVLQALNAEVASIRRRRYVIPVPFAIIVLRCNLA